MRSISQKVYPGQRAWEYLAQLVDELSMPKTAIPREYLSLLLVDELVELEGGDVVLTQKGQDWYEKQVKRKEKSLPGIVKKQILVEDDINEFLDIPTAQLSEHIVARTFRANDILVTIRWKGKILTVTLLLIVDKASVKNPEADVLGAEIRVTGIPAELRRYEDYLKERIAADLEHDLQLTTDQIKY